MPTSKKLNEDNIMLKHYVTFFYPGIFASETEDRPVETRERTPDVPKGAYAWRFYDREEMRQGKETLAGKPKNHSPTHYVGTELSAKEAISMGGVLADNVRINGYKRLVKTRGGQIFPLDDDDVIVKVS
jgi:hypothetical protein